MVTGVTLAYALIRAARTLDHVSAAIDRTVDEALPLFGKAGEALDQVSGQLANAEQITGPAADAVDAAERSARAVIAGVSEADRCRRRCGVVGRPGGAARVRRPRE